MLPDVCPLRDVIALLGLLQAPATSLRPCSAPAYWITSSARTRSDEGNVIPRALAVLRLSTSSNFVGCSTGRSAGLAPLRSLSTYVAPCRHTSGTLAA